MIFQCQSTRTSICQSFYPPEPLYARTSIHHMVFRPSLSARSWKGLAPENPWPHTQLATYTYTCHQDLCLSANSPHNLIAVHLVLYQQCSMAARKFLHIKLQVKVSQKSNVRDFGHQKLIGIWGHTCGRRSNYWFVKGIRLLHCVPVNKR